MATIVALGRLPGGRAAEMGDTVLTDSSMRDLLNHVVEFLQWLDFPQTLEVLYVERAEKRKTSFNSSICTRGATKESRERLRVEMVSSADVAVASV